MYCRDAQRTGLGRQSKRRIEQRIEEMLRLSGRLTVLDADEFVLLRCIRVSPLEVRWRKGARERPEDLKVYVLLRDFRGRGVDHLLKEPEPSLNELDCDVVACREPDNTVGEAHGM